MTGDQLRDRAESIAENAFLKLIGRVGMATAFPVMVAGMTWLGSTIWSLNSEQGRILGRLDLLSERIELSMRIRDQRIDDLTKKIDRMEKH